MHCYNKHMNTQIIFTDTVVINDSVSVPIIATVSKNGCDVTVGDELTLGSITWEQMADVEYLSTLFADTQVRTFKVIVALLGKVYAFRDVYAQMHS